MGVYICTLKVDLTPIKKNSRRHPISTVVEQQPMVLDEDMSIHPKYAMISIRRILKDRVTDFSPYHIKYSVSNCKFSTKCQWKS
jgi:hypothetical protein